ncbi:flagellar filament capping protein FliD [Halomonas qaidamensis]|uniref:Flagellar hook-associated protein 2 n=1 Tax=Halomonas qaidamensis TaxID=2866211 RepID=A0ABY6JNW3_9GAMM|nr:flagellar filament capping protein FliD [Halomonas qaidamensis]UYV18861.1 flagellar filament capping protein FliD [Halomonas qaidamensis]
MATITSLGVGSGLDLNGLVDQLRNAERQKLIPITQQKNQQQTKISAFGRLQSALSRFQESVVALDDAKLFSSQKSTSSSDAVRVTTSADATAGYYDINVTQLARAGSIASNSVAMETVLAEVDATLTLDFGATYQDGVLQPSVEPLSSYSITISAGSTLATIRDQINADQNAGVSASIVNDGTGYRLALNSKDTGAVASVTGFSGVAGLSADDATYRAGTDAALQMNGISITSANNRVEGAIQGVSLDLTATGKSSVVIERDTEALKEAIQNFVSGYNELKSTLGRLTLATGDRDTAGDLVGDNTVRSIEGRLRRDLLTSVEDSELGVLSQLGLALDLRGRLGLDETKLDALIASEPDALSGFFAGTTKQGGLAGRLTGAMDELLGDKGPIQGAIENAEKRMARLDDRFIRSEAMIERTVSRYRTQFAQLDVMLGQMNSMSMYLTQQFDALSAQTVRKR